MVIALSWLVVNLHAVKMVTTRWQYDVVKLLDMKSEKYRKNYIIHSYNSVRYKNRLCSRVKAVVLHGIIFGKVKIHQIFNYYLYDHRL